MQLLEYKLDQVLAILANQCHTHASDQQVSIDGPPGLEHVSAVLNYLRPGADEFVPASKEHVQEESCGRESLQDSLTHLQARVETLDNEIGELQSEQSSHAAEIAAVCRSLEERLEVEISRVRSQSDDDYSQVAKSVAALETKFSQCIARSDQASEPAAEIKIDLSCNLDGLTPNQKGLFKQLGGQLNRLVPSRRRKRLDELQDNLRNWEDGSLKEQQLQVLKLLEHLLNG